MRLRGDLNKVDIVITQMALEGLQKRQNSLAHLGEVRCGKEKPREIQRFCCRKTTPKMGGCPFYSNLKRVPSLKATHTHTRTN